MAKGKILLVDLDGTVYNSNSEPFKTVSWLRLERAVMELYGRKLDFDWKSKAGGTEKGVAEAVIRGLGSGLLARNETPRLIREMDRQYMLAAREAGITRDTYEAVYPGVTEGIAKLGKLGFTVGFLSGGSDFTVHHKLFTSGLLDSGVVDPGLIFTGQNFSTREEEMVAAFDFVGVDEGELNYVGDALGDYLAARRFYEMSRMGVKMRLFLRQSIGLKTSIEGGNLDSDDRRILLGQLAIAGGKDGSSSTVIRRNFSKELVLCVYGGEIGEEGFLKGMRNLGLVKHDEVERELRGSRGREVEGCQ